MADDRVKALKRARRHFDEERRWHKFLLDAYQGSGGFRGRIGCVETELGSAASVYSTYDSQPRHQRQADPSDTYLDRHQREDDEKFRRRKAISHYPNYVEPLTDLKVGFALSKPFVVDNLPQAIADWKKDVDGQGTSFELIRRRVATRAAIFGWVPCLVDLPEAGETILTQAQAQAAGIAPRLVPLYPANLTEWEIDGGTMAWAKVRVDHCERPDPFGDEREYAEISIWYSDRVLGFELEKGSDELRVEPEHAHAFLRVPIAVCRHKPAEDDPVHGIPMHGSVSLEARRLFNLVSALDNNLDSQGFAMLVLAEKPLADADSPDGEDERAIGPDNAMTIDPESKQPHYYLAPPASVAEAFEQRIKETISEIYRMARVEFIRPAGSANESGLARKHAFAQTNNAIELFAQELALWERDIYVLVGRALSVPEAELEAIKVIAPTDFDIEDIDAEIERVVTAVTLKLGAHANALLRKRIVEAVLPGLDEKDRATIDAEIEQLAADEASGDAFGQGGADPAAAGFGMNDVGGSGGAANGGGNSPFGQGAGASGDSPVGGP